MPTRHSQSEGRDSSLDDLHLQYERALSRNKEARSRLAQLQSKIVGPSKDTASTATDWPRHKHLESHLDNLRLQRRHKKLQSLSQLSLDAEKIGHDENVFDAWDPASRPMSELTNDDHQDALTETQGQLDALLKGAGTMTTSLELALVKARQQLKFERALLEKAKGRTDIRHNGATTGADILYKQRALEATRSELQNWIGESLARCEQDSPLSSEPEISNSDIPGLEQRDEGADSNAIEAQYDRYLEARLQLVAAARALKVPLPELEIKSRSKPASRPRAESTFTTEDHKQKIQLQRAPHLRHKSRISVNKIMEQSGGVALAKIESTLIPEYHHEKLLDTHLAHLGGQTMAQDSRLSQSLGLLSHESHLLPSYPPPPPESTQAGQTGGANKQQSEIGNLLRAWAFASQEAGVALRESVLDNIEKAQLALDGASQSVNEMSVMESMKKEVIAGKK